MGKNLELIGTGGNFLNTIPMVHVQRSRIDKWDLMKLKSFCKAKNIVNKTNQQPTDCEKLFTNPKSDRGLALKYIRTQEVNHQKTKQPNQKIGYRTKLRIHN